jgi:hypothetical protein
MISSMEVKRMGRTTLMLDVVTNLPKRMMNLKRMKSGSL